MEKETLKEATENYLKDVNTKVHKDLDRDNWLKMGFINGAKWQKQISFSDEEVLDILYKHTEDLFAGKKLTLEEWFNEFKKN